MMNNRLRDFFINTNVFVT